MIKNKTVVIGLDGATFDLIGPWIEEGRLPFIKELIDNGCSGILKSTVPPISPVAWTSFMTGMNAGKHGIFDFVEPVRTCPPGIRVNNRNNCKQKPIWRYLNDAGYKTAVINVPMTFPPDEIDGVMISGMDTPNIRSGFIYPPEFKKELFEKIGGYVIEVKHSPKRCSKTGRYIESLCGMVRNRFNATEYLLKKAPWDFLMVVFMAGDRAQHNLWKFMDPNHPLYNKTEAGKYSDGILKVYQELDRAVGSISKSLDDETNLIIMSDHGAGVLYKTISLNNWLADEGFLSFKKGRRNPVHFLSDLAGDAAAFLHRAKCAVTRKKGEKANRFFESIEWSKTKAFFIGAWGKIFINMKGRDPYGIVEPGNEYESVRNEIIGKLMELKDPDTGKSVVNRVMKREEIFEGEYSLHAPDMVIMWEKGYNSIIRMEDLRKGVRSYKKGSVFGLHMRLSGDHTQNGLFIIRSPHVEKNRKNLNAHIMDICPTILHMMDIQVPISMDGKVPVEIFKKDFLKGRPVRYSGIKEMESKVSGETGYSKKESEEIEERLRSLGYLE